MVYAPEAGCCLPAGLPEALLGAGSGADHISAADQPVVASRYVPLPEFKLVRFEQLRVGCPPPPA
jgi:hypothetical protein